MDDTIILVTFLIYADDSRRKCHVDVESTAQKCSLSNKLIHPNNSSLFLKGILGTPDVNVVENMSTRSRPLARFCFSTASC
jgi:hypothetical protein